MSTRLPVKHTCGGDIVADNGAFTCLGCGTEYVTNHEKHQFILLYRDIIMASLEKYGQPATTKAWNISRTTLLALSRQAVIHSLAPPAPPPLLSANGYLPAFPPFSDQWDAAVQTIWLVIYLALKNIGTHGLTNDKPGH